MSDRPYCAAKMTHLFDDAIELEAEGELRYRANLDKRLWGPRAPHGGYLGALVLAAMTEAVADPAFSPRSITLHYPSAVREGTAEIRVVVERRGRRVVTLSAALVQEDRSAVLALAVFGIRAEQERFDAAKPPPMAPPEDCEKQRSTVPVDEHFELRIGIGPGPFQGASEARYGGWARFRPPRAVDAPGMFALADAWWPAFLPMLESPKQVGLAPTLDLTVHFHAELPLRGLDADAYLAVEIECDHIGDGYFAERASIWAPDGTLLAQSVQHGLHVQPEPEP